MNDDVTAGGASTAVVEEELVSLKDITESERKDYLEKDILPKRTKTEPTSDGGKTKPAESGAAPDAATKDKEEPKTDDTEPPKRESRAERRIRKLTDEIKQLRAELATKAETKP